MAAIKFQPWSFAIAGAAFLTGLLTQVSVNVVGNMPLAEFVLLAVAALLTVHIAIERRLSAELYRLPLFWLLLAGQVIAFAAYVFSDLYRGTATNDMLRGWSRMVFLAIDVIAIVYLYSQKASCFIWSQAGLMLGGLLSVLINGAQYDAYWKFGFGGPVTVAVFLISPFLGRVVGIAVVAALGLLHLSLDFRSMGGLCLLTAVLLGIQIIPRQLRVLLLIPALAGGTALTFWLNSREREDEARGSRSTVERTAMMTAAWEGFVESPLIGQGSWFSNSRVMDNFQILRNEGARLAGVHGYAIETEETNVAIHSQLLVSVAEGGIFGGTFFILFGAAIAWALLYCTIWREADGYTPIYIFVLLNATWNLLASPFSGAHRLGIAIVCGLILLLWRESRNPAPDEEEVPEFVPGDDAALHELRS